DPACVKSVLQAAPGVEKTTYEVYPTIQRFTWSGFPKEVPPYTYLFRYSGSSYLINLDIKDDTKGHVAFHQVFLTVNRPPDPVIVAASRSSMRYVEGELETRFGVEHLPELVKESCLKVACPAR